MNYKSDADQNQVILLSFHKLIIFRCQTKSQLERSWFLRQSAKTPAIAGEGEKCSAVFYQVTGVHLMCQIFMNDLLTEQGQQRSRVIR